MNQKTDVLNVCRCCGKSFRAPTFKKYCSDTCAKKYHKHKNREERLGMDVKSIKSKELSKLRDLEVLTVSQMATYLDVTWKTANRMLKRYGISKIHVSAKLVKVRREDIEFIRVSLKANRQLSLTLPRFIFYL